MPRLDSDNVALGAFIRERREEAGLTMEQLAEMSSTSRSTLSRLEHGEMRPRANNLARVLVALGVTSTDAEQVLSCWPGFAQQVEAHTRQAAVSVAQAYVRPSAGTERAELLLMRADGTRATVAVAWGESAERDPITDELVRCLKRAGWTVARPL